MRSGPSVKSSSARFLKNFFADTPPYTTSDVGKIRPARSNLNLQKPLM
jgi:hypothetical protein